MVCHPLELEAPIGQREHVDRLGRRRPQAPDAAGGQLTRPREVAGGEHGGEHGLFVRLWCARRCVDAPPAPHQMPAPDERPKLIL